MGRPPLDEKLRTYFMKKSVDLENPTKKDTRKFSFTLEATEEGEKLIDAYVGVEFSIVVSYLKFVDHMSLFCSSKSSALPKERMARMSSKMLCSTPLVQERASS